jgi:hypothetical protein
MIQETKTEIQSQAALSSATIPTSTPDAVEG